MIKLNKEMYVSDEKLNAIAKMYPTSYLASLEAVYEIIRHTNNRTETEDTLVIENVFGKVGFKRDHNKGIWLLEYALFASLDNI